MSSPDPRMAGASKYYGQARHPRCIKCENETHPVGKTTEDGPICTHCIGLGN